MAEVGFAGLGAGRGFLAIRFGCTRFTSFFGEAFGFDSGSDLVAMKVRVLEIPLAMVFADSVTH